ncbi:MAG: hypothetical protein E7A67_03360 [Peptostreptococcus anaerobius]|uniref:hypothetical protein n=1 Tax=Peptostreptococcus anaerobius TaxID=1261 RepID=UPI002431F88B|nr:hypothetical protein [Peptostreptococcus anaerobius]MDU0964039.1 hypothetical protein [Peptostreptococcus anaerobius]MDU0997787.1 hypothetical protein [Peptostreptococcus anaerobius]
MSLEHVCEWTENGWKHVTIEEVREKHGNVGISSSTRQFVCSLCGSSVSFTKGSELRSNYFKHAKNSNCDIDKFCSDRAQNHYFKKENDFKKYTLPIRFKWEPEDSLDIEIGFLPIPNELIEKNLDKLLRISVGDKIREKPKLKINYDNFNSEYTSFVGIGSILDFKSEHVEIIQMDEEITNYWPKEVKVLEKSYDGSYYAVFDCESRKKLPSDADVVVNKEYYIISTKYIVGINEIVKEDIKTKYNCGNTWYISKVKAQSFCFDAAKFFMSYGCRLTDKSISIYPVWPPYIKRDHSVFLWDNYLHLFTSDNSKEIKIYSESKKKVLRDDNIKLVKIDSANKNLLTMGRVRVLRYFHLNRTKIKNTESKYLECEITRQDGEVISENILNELPINDVLYIEKIICDGYFVIKNNGTVKQKGKLKADKKNEIEGFKYGDCLEIYIGLDCIRSISFEREIKSFYSQNEILRKIKSYHGDEIPLDISFSNIAISYKDDTDIFSWIKEKIKNGKISQRAFNELKINCYKNRR